MSLQYTETFATNFSTVNTLQANGNTVTGSSSPSGILGNIQIAGGSFQSTMRSSDTATNGGIRAETAYTATATGNVNEFTFQMLINQADWDDGTHNGTQVSVCQLHTLDTNVFANEFALLLYNDCLYVWIPATQPPATGMNYLETPIWNFTYGIWHNICFRISLQTTTGGFIEVVYDNISIWKASMLGTAYSSDAPYFKLGVYDATHTNVFGNYRTAYYKNLNIWQGIDGSESYLGTGIVPQPQPIALIP